jgi:hypothetical protein
VQFRPFHFQAHIAAGVDVSVAGHSFASVGLDGTISGPGPITVHGSLSIDVFLFSISWNETFTLGDGPADVLPTPPLLLDVLAQEFTHPASVQAAGIGDAHVVLRPGPAHAAVAAVPPTGALQVRQRRAPLGVLVERIDGRPLAAPQGAVITGAGAELSDRFAPGSYITLTAAEALNRPPFDVLPAGRVLTGADPPFAVFPQKPDPRTVKQIVIRSGVRHDPVAGARFDITALTGMVAAAGRPPALSDPSPMVRAAAETWTTTASGAAFDSATAAHQSARHRGGVALAAVDAADPVDLAGVI